MGERNQTQTEEGLDDLYDPNLADFGDGDFDNLTDESMSVR